MLGYSQLFYLFSFLPLCCAAYGLARTSGCNSHIFGSILCFYSNTHKKFEQSWFLLWQLDKLVIANKFKIWANSACWRIKKVPSEPGNWSVVILLTLDVPPCVLSWNLLNPCQFDAYLGFGILINPMPFYVVCIPRFIVCIAGWTTRVSVLSQVVFLLQSQSYRLHCNHAHFMGFAVSCSHVFGLFCICLNQSNYQVMNQYIQH